MVKILGTDFTPDQIARIFRTESDRRIAMAKIMKILAYELYNEFKDSQLIEHDGRKRWMVRWDKWKRTVAENDRLKAENEKLRGIIEDYLKSKTIDLKV